MSRLSVSAVVVGSLALGACVAAPPAGPQVVVMPGAGKTLAQFQQDDATCRQYASQQVGGAQPAQAASDSAVGSAVAGTGIGAAAGALLGAASGNAGAGAAVGAGAGLLMGSAVGANNAQASGAAVQRRYDIGYMQCMAAQGDNVPPVQQGARPAYYPAYAYYPPGPYYAPSVAVGFGWRHW